MIIEVLLWAFRILCVLVVALAVGVVVTAAQALLHRTGEGRHQAPAGPNRSPHPRGLPDYDTGSMTWDDEKAYLIRRDGVVFIDRGGEVVLEPWEPPHGAVSGAIWDKQELWNGHIPGCLAPNGDHHWTACPEEEDLSDDDDPVPPLPDMLPAPAAVTELVDTALARAEADPGDAGWTDQLLAELREAPTVLDTPADCRRCGCPPAIFPQNSDGLCSHCSLALTRLADTGEIELASQRADYAAELRAQDDDVKAFISRQASDLASFRLTLRQ